MLYKPEYSPEQMLAAYDDVLDAVRQQGIERDELDEVKVKFRSDYFSSLEGGHGGYIPRYGLMHYLACFTLFDDDPLLVNSILDGFNAVTLEQVRAAAQKYLDPARRALVIRRPVEERRCLMADVSARQSASSKTSALETPAAFEVPSLSPERPVVWPARTYRKLPNGLELVLVEAHTVPKFTGQLYFRSGNAAVGHRARPRRNHRQRRAHRHPPTLQPPDRGGSPPHGRRPGRERRRGYQRDCLQWISRICSRPARSGCRPRAQRFFSSEEFEHERRQMVEGLRIERTTPSFLGNERLRRVLFGQHPYSILSPTEAQVEAYQRDQLLEFYRTHYEPAEALLVLVGLIADTSVWIDHLRSSNKECAGSKANRRR